MSSTVSPKQGRFFSRRIDYLGELGERLRDLKGYATLAHELIQNADDAKDASSVVFDVTEAGLIVDNDGCFTDCGQVEEETCVWEHATGTERVMCDFHRFSLVGSGNKREERGTAGAFGFGFTAVYQITDRPELISSARHWILSEERREDERIYECPGCNRCLIPDPPGTRFILPWARDPGSELRTRLKAEAVPQTGPRALVQELERSIRTALLFVKKISSIEIRENGQLRRRVERVEDGDSLIINDGEDHIWHRLRGSFDEAAARLREQHADRIEPKRSADVVVAIPVEPLQVGLLCAFLPTQHQTGLPFHINADFYTTNDRKRINFDSDYQSDWNQAAVRAAARALCDGFEGLRARLGIDSHKRIWEIVAAVQRVASEAASRLREPIVGEFWRILAPRLRTSPVIFSAGQEWHTVSEALLLYEKEEESSVSLLEALGIPIVHNDLRPQRNLLLSSEVGVRRLDVSDVAQALVRHGLTKRTGIGQLPGCLQTRAARESLWCEIDLLLSRKRSVEELYRVKQELSACAIALGTDSALWPCRAIYHADPETIEIFSKIAPGTPFLADTGDVGGAVRSLCNPFSAAAAVECLSRLAPDDVESARKQGRLRPARLLGWFETHRDEILRSDNLRPSFVALSVFPSSERLRPLTALALPGDFQDELDLAELVALKDLGERCQFLKEFLKELGATELTFQKYATEFIPRAFLDPELSLDKKRAAVGLLSQRASLIWGSESARSALRAVPIVECTDGSFCRPFQVYMPSDVVRDVLGPGAKVAVLRDQGAGPTRELYRWLGVADWPRSQDIVDRIKALVAAPPDQTSLRSVSILFGHLGERHRRHEGAMSELSLLRDIRWLPAQGASSWFSPKDVFAVFQKRIFESQARFLDLPYELQRDNTSLLDFFGVKTSPPPALVVAHLLRSVEAKVAIHKDVYRALNDAAQDSSVLKLKGKACLLLPDNTYIRPDQAFWGGHCFRRFRHQLGPELRRYNDLFTVLEVRDTADHRDAIKVIKEISAEYSAANRPLDDEANGALLDSWRMLDQALSSGMIGPDDLADLRASKVVPDRRRVLTLPKRLFFEDRAGLGVKFGAYLENHIVARMEGLWKAMAQVGVRLLSNEIRSQLLECTDPADDELVRERVQRRCLQLHRVLGSDISNAELTLGALSEVRFCSASSLIRRYFLCPFGREIGSEPETVAAHFQREENLLYFVRTNGRLPWLSIAKELALALYPDVEPGRLTLGIKTVLEAETEESARSILDESGFAPLEARVLLQAPTGSLIRDFGGETGRISPTSPSENEAAIDRTGRASGRGTELRPDAHPRETTPPEPSSIKQPIEGTPGPAAAPPAPLRPEVVDRETEGPGHPGSGKQASTYPEAGGSGKGRRGRLRTYVYPDGADVPEPGVADMPDRTPVEKAGVDRVRQYEESQDRFPAVMPPKHPGYDLESKDAGGDVARYIEVKSLSGTWDSLGAALSKTQFEKAKAFGDKYWLYVVERARQEDYKIHRIQDPARRVDQFFYDDGWRGLAEPDPPGTPEQEVP